MHQLHSKFYKLLTYCSDFFQLDDANVILDRERASVNSLEKKQKKFDALLAEEKGQKERLQSEKENIEKENRNKETKVISLTRELEELQDQLAESERIRKAQQAELEDHLSNKDDVGKSVSIHYFFSLEKVSLRMFKNTM